eukprot:Hpha_TRINITY_DN35519_c0_g1::TRINITY_DN35519_c0_g1_i1::g.84538::m.84538
MPPRLVLCTDLDGTFLGDPGREALYEAVERHRPQVLLVYATGRSLPDVRRRLGWDPGTESTGPRVPTPDFLICDVGTTVYHGSPPYGVVASVQDWILKSWGDAGARVKDMLAGEEGLELQGGGAGWEVVDGISRTGPDMCRVSYYYSSACALDKVRQRVQAAGLQFIASHGKFLDILPGGVGKGTTLLQLLAECGVDRRLSVVAGDTCNDLSLFEVCSDEGPRGVVVGNAESALREALASKEAAGCGIHFASAHGAAGVWEGLVQVYGHKWLLEPSKSAL